MVFVGYRNCVLPQDLEENTPRSHAWETVVRQDLFGKADTGFSMSHFPQSLHGECPILPSLTPWGYDQQLSQNNQSLFQSFMGASDGSTSQPMICSQGSVTGLYGQASLPAPF